MSDTDTTTSTTETVRFDTENSAYELDLTAKRIRRLNGTADPTPRQGPDGEWKSYTDISPLQVGARVAITWSIDVVDGEAIARATETSLITAIS